MDQKKMHMSEVLMSMMDASIYMRMSTDMITPDGGKAKATLGATAHATPAAIQSQILFCLLAGDILF